MENIMDFIPALLCVIALALKKKLFAFAWQEKPTRSKNGRFF
ncbi:MAG: hypothetical protein ACOCP6_01635 [Desulfosalsimonas sp.]